MSGLGSYGSGSYYSSSLMAPSMNQNRRSDRGDYDDRRYAERSEPRSRFSDNYREQSDLVGPRRQSRFSPPPYSGGQRGDRRQDQRSKAVSYPLGHLGHQGSSRSDYDRDDEDLGYSRDRNRSGNRNRNGGMRRTMSLNEGPGILGAKPGAQPPHMPPDLSSPLQGLGLSGLSPDGLRAQIAQQQQQLMAMVQTQSLLAAVQAQANSQVNPRPPQFNPAGLLPTPPMPPERRNHPQQMRKRRNDSPMQGGNYGKRDRQSYDNRNRNQQGYNNRRGNQWGQRQNRRPQQQQRKVSSPQSRSTSETKEDKSKNDVRGETAKKADKAVEENESEEPKSDKEKTEEVSSRDDKDPSQNDKPCSVVNFLGQDVEAMITKLFNSVKQQYVCTDCKIICNKLSSFRQHLLGKRHSKTILENAGKELDLDEWKEFQDKERLQEQPKKPVPVEEKTEESTMDTVAPNQDVPLSPGLPHPDEECDFVKYTCDTRKMAVKNDDLITISSITEAKVRITGFTSGRNMYGCEFVKAVAGFNCRLCKTFIRYGNDVTSHIQGKKHQRNYELYIHEHPQYVENQLSRNKELELILEKREGEEVVLYEVLDEDVKKSRRRRRDSQGAEQSEVPITKFVIAPSAEDKPVHDIPCEEAESTEDEVIDSLLQDSVEVYGSTLEEDEDELKQDTAIESLESERLLLMEDEENPVDDIVKENEVAQLPEVKAEEEEEEPLATSPSRPVAEVESEDSQPQEKKTPVGSSKRAGKTVKAEPKLETGDSESQEEKMTPSPSPRRGGRRGGRGGRAGGRGRGRGRGSRRSTRNAVPPGSVEMESVSAKEEEQATDADTEDMSFMDGFEVIDEIAEED